MPTKRQGTIDVPAPSPRPSDPLIDQPVVPVTIDRTIDEPMWPLPPREPVG